MADRSAAFLEEVLGKDGAAALMKAVQRSPALASVLVPRAIIGWTMAATAWGYSGKLPGTDLEVSFSKSETPGRYSASIQDSKSNGLHVFGAAPFHRIAAHIAVALEVPEVRPAPGLKDLDLARLGKSIDALAKAQLLAQATAPTVMSSHGDVDVIHAGVGQTPYSLRRRKDGRVLIDNIHSLADAQRLGDWQASIHNPTVPATDDLDKVALNPSLGYKLSHEHHDLGGGQMMTKVNVHAPTGEHVGAANFLHQPGGLKLSTVVVDEDHQRRGLGSAMLQHAQRAAGKPLVASTQQTPEGAGLWNANMGKVELPGMSAKPMPQQGPQEPQAPQKQPRQAGPPPAKADGKGPGVKAPPRTKEQMPSTQAPQVPQVKVPSMKVGKSEAHGSACPVCKQLQFGPDGGFYGCLCFRGMCQDVVVKAEADGYELSFGDIWDEDARSALLEALRPV